MSSIEIPFLKDPIELQKRLYANHQIQIPIFNWEEKTFLRITFNKYDS